MDTILVPPDAVDYAAYQLAEKYDLMYGFSQGLARLIVEDCLNAISQYQNTSQQKQASLSQVQWTPLLLR